MGGVMIWMQAMDLPGDVVEEHAAEKRDESYVYSSPYQVTEAMYELLRGRGARHAVKVMGESLGICIVLFSREFGLIVSACQKVILFDFLDCRHMS